MNERRDSPFRAIHANAWADPVDVPSINRDASDLILTRIEEVRRAGGRSDRALSSTSILLLGPAGAGKTHLFARLRKQVRGPAVFIHTRPQIGVEPTPRFVLASIVDSLRQPVLNDEHLQIEIVVGALLAAHEGGDARFPLMSVEDARRMSEEARSALIDRVVEHVEDRFPEIAPDYLARLLVVPFAGRQERRALLAWLSGREPGAVELERLGAPGPLADMDVMRALSTLGVATAYGAPVVLVFDQLENLAEDDGRTSRIHAHARLVSDLRDTVRGLVIVQMALDAEWTTRIHPALHASDRDRLEETVRLLSLPTPAERRALLERWREALGDEERGRPFPYPFGLVEVNEWLHASGMTPRMLMQACGEAYLRGPVEQVGAVVESDPADALTAQWAEALEKARCEIDEAAQQKRGVSPERMAGGLLAALRVLRVKAALSGAAIRAANDGSTAEVIFAQHANHRSLAAAIRAAAGQLPNASRVVLLRERALAISPTWKEVDRCLSAFTASPRAVFAWIDREDVARLLAAEAFVTAARSQDLPGPDGRPIPAEAVLDWMARSLGCASWPAVEGIVAPAAPAASPAPIAKPPPAAPPPPPPRSAPVTGPVLSVLARLHVASVERVVREAKALDATLTRARVVEELRRIPARFFGESIVVMAERRS